MYSREGFSGWGFILVGLLLCGLGRMIILFEVCVGGGSINLKVDGRLRVFLGRKVYNLGRKWCVLENFRSLEMVFFLIV